MYDRRVGEIPSMGMGRIDPAKRGEELSTLKLKIERQACGLQECFFHFDVGVVVVVELENDIGKPFEVGIDRAIECELDIAGVEAALLRIVVAALDVFEIARARAGKGEQSIERNVHVVLPASDPDRLGEGRAGATCRNRFGGRG